MTAELSETDSESRAIIGLYLLFARLLNEELNPELRNILLQPEVLSALAKAEPTVREYLSVADFDYEQAAVDFCDTFILPEKSIQPRAAAWPAEGESVSPDGIHAVVDAFLETESIELPLPYKKLPFDHASVLFFLAANLRERNSDQAAAFEDATLRPWLDVFSNALSNSAVNPLYRSLGILLLLRI